MHGIAAKMRLRTAAGRDEAQATVRRITGELAGLAEQAARDAERLLANAHRALRRAQLRAERLAAVGCATLRRAVNDLVELLDATRRIAAQTRQRVAGTTPGRGDPPPIVPTSRLFRPCGWIACWARDPHATSRHNPGPYSCGEVDCN